MSKKKRKNNELQRRNAELVSENRKLRLENAQLRGRLSEGGHEVPEMLPPVVRVVSNPRREFDPSVSAWNDMQIANIRADTADRPSSSRPRIEVVQEGEMGLIPALTDVLMKSWRNVLGLQAPPVAFSTDFDEECKAYISSLIEPYPVVLKRCEYGMGLFAPRNIQMFSTVLEEDPLFSLTQDIVDRLESVIDDSAGRVALGSRSLLVAGMVRYAVDSPEYPCKISDMLPLRCLGSIPKESAKVRLLILRLNC